MSYYNGSEIITIEGVFVGFISGGYVFHLENDDMIDFDSINLKILETFDLKSNEFKNKKFEITYSENTDDLEDEDVVFKLEQLKLM